MAEERDGRSPAPGGPGPEPGARPRRLAEAMRENLRRRKEQRRAREPRPPAPPDPVEDR